MRFLSVHKASSYLVVSTGMLAIFLSRELNPWFCAASLLLLVFSWIWEEPRVTPSRFSNMWNVITVLVLAKSIVDLLLGESVLLTGIYFILFLSINKLFNRSSSIDYLQLYVLSLLQMIAATTLSTDLTYGFLFLFYIVFSTWSLILFHLKREMEDNYLLKYGDTVHGKPVQIRRVLNSRKLVGPPFLVATSAVSLVVFLGSALFFFAFPRIGFRFFNQARPGISMAGFSDRIELGSFGLIKDNPTVVLRVEFETKEAQSRLAPYWRGTSFDHYDGTTWTKSLGKRRRKLKRDGLNIQLGTPTVIEGQPVKQTIYLEPMETQVVFGLDEMAQLVLDRSAQIALPSDYRAIETDEDGDLYYEQSSELAFRYTALSQRESSPPDLLNLPLDEYRRLIKSRPDNARFLQLPKEMSNEVLSLAQDITSEATTVGAAINAVETYLKQNYQYTLKLERDESRPPLDDFLLIQRKGHCEYFSTAMTILLRAIGVATRSVNGFYGGRWNEFGQYMAIHQGDAHSWMEVLLPKERCEATAPRTCTNQNYWLRRDPTPSGQGRDRYGFVWGTFLQYTDALRLRWYKYVIEYDLKQQVSMVLSLSSLWSELKPAGPSHNNQRGAGLNLRWVIIGLLALVLTSILGLLILRWRTTRPQTLTEEAKWIPEVTDLYERLCKVYEEHGFARRRNWTSRDFLGYLESKSAPETELANDVIGFYEEVRFGHFKPDSGQIGALRDRIAGFATSEQKR